jgi:MoaA/NifB/PqqE/SkfB family radical SAM enzyme
MPGQAVQKTEFLWLEITGRCQLTCTHCYAASGPQGTHGSLTTGDWERLIDEAAGLGVTWVQFIGGEVTLHPGLPGLVRHALAAGLRVEVFTNLVHVTRQQWEVFSLPGVSLATSWYSADPQQHAAITGRDTYRQTKANIAEALQRSIPLRVAIIDGIIPDQRAEQAKALLETVGARDIGVDRERAFGRGTIPDPTQTCGGCGKGRAAILPDGNVTPCPMSRWRVVGNVTTSELGTLLGGPLTAAAGDLAPASPDACNPRCTPDSYCNPLCSPGACKPRT